MPPLYRMPVVYVILIAGGLVAAGIRNRVRQPVDGSRRRRLTLSIAGDAHRIHGASRRRQGAMANPVAHGTNAAVHQPPIHTGRQPEGTDLLAPPPASGAKSSLRPWASDVATSPRAESRSGRRSITFRSISCTKNKARAKMRWCGSARAVRLPWAGCGGRPFWSGTRDRWP